MKAIGTFFGLVIGVVASIFAAQLMGDKNQIVRTVGTFLYLLAILDEIVFCLLVLHFFEESKLMNRLAEKESAGILTFALMAPILIGICMITVSALMWGGFATAPVISVVGCLIVFIFFPALVLLLQAMKNTT